MKKHILLLMATIMVSFTVAMGQPLQPSTATALSAIPTFCATPTPVSCTSDALRPVPGSPYTYSITVPNSTEFAQGLKYRWFVTQDPNILTTTGGATSFTSDIKPGDGTGIHIQSAVANYNDLVNGSNQIVITWKSFVHVASAPVLVVIYVVGEDGCLTNNMEVYEIQPVHAFTLDIANMASDGTIVASGHETCVSPVESAIYNPGTKTMAMNYGTNYLYFAVNAANFTDSWLPEFQLSGHGGRTTTIEWQRPALANVATGWNAATVAVQATAGAGASVGAAGECIIVRVTIAHAAEETIADLTITLAVNGIMNDPTRSDLAVADYTDRTFEDVHHADCTADGFTNDIANQVIKQRPDLNSSTPDAAGTGTLPFQTKN